MTVLAEATLPLEVLLGMKGLVAPEEGRRLADLAAGVPAAEAIVEIGSHRGLSSCWLAAGSRAGNGAHVTCIDPWPLYGTPGDPLEDPEWAEEGALERWGTNIALVSGWAITTPLRSTAISVAAMWAKPVGLFFHDADHAFKSVTDDYLAWLPYLAPGAWVAVHDYYANTSDGAGGWIRDTTRDRHQRAVDQVILPSGTWADVEIIGTTDGSALPNLWLGRRVGPP